MKKTNDNKNDEPTTGEHVDNSGEPLEGEPAAESAIKDGESIAVDPMERIAELEEKILRAKADFQNLQRRSATQRAEAIRYANADLMKSLLIVADDFERSLEAAPESEETKPIVDGIRLVYENFMKALRDNGLEVIPGRGESFDPHIHEAMLQQPSADHEPGTVIEEIAKGYRLRDRVIRPAKVIVSKSPDGSPASSDSATPATAGDAPEESPQ